MKYDIYSALRREKEKLLDDSNELLNEYYKKKRIKWNIYYYKLYTFLILTVLSTILIICRVNVININNAIIFFSALTIFVGKIAGDIIGEVYSKINTGLNVKELKDSIGKIADKIEKLDKDIDFVNYRINLFKKISGDTTNDDTKVKVEKKIINFDCNREVKQKIRNRVLIKKKEVQKNEQQ